MIMLYYPSFTMLAYWAALYGPECIYPLSTVYWSWAVSNHLPSLPPSHPPLPFLHRVLPCQALWVFLGQQGPCSPTSGGPAHVWGCHVSSWGQQTQTQCECAIHLWLPYLPCASEVQHPHHLWWSCSLSLSLLPQWVSSPLALFVLWYICKPSPSFHFQCGPYALTIPLPPHTRALSPSLSVQCLPDHHSPHLRAHPLTAGPKGHVQPTAGAVLQGLHQVDTHHAQPAAERGMGSYNIIICIHCSRWWQCCCCLGLSLFVMLAVLMECLTLITPSISPSPPSLSAVWGWCPLDGLCQLSGTACAGWQICHTLPKVPDPHVG